VPSAWRSSAPAPVAINSGTAVFFGMIGVTGFGLIFTPTFYVVARGLAKRFERRAPETADAAPHAGPHPQPAE
jgi:hypothetical protein